MSTSIDKLSDPASVVAWLDSHEFDERAKQVLAGFTAHDLKSLTREDAKELLGAATGIRLFNRVNNFKSRSSSSSSSLSLRSLVEEATDKLSLHDRTTSSEEQNSSDEDDSSPHTLASTTDDSRYSSRSPSRSPHPEFGQSKKKKKNSVLLSPLQVSAVARLAAYYPRQTRLNVHMSSSSHGKRLDCCSSALASLRASVAATESDHGISGSLAWLTRAFQWGSSRCEYLCECIMSCSSLDCGAGASLAVRLLRECSETKGENATISIVGVQLILRHSEQEYKRWNDLWKREDLLRAKDARWLDESGVHLHQAVGIITLATNEMAVWNYGTWIRASNDLNAKAAPLAIRVDPFNDLMNESPEDDLHVTRVIPSSVIFGGFAINVDEWTSLMPPDTAVSGLPSAVKVPILSSCSSPYTSLLSTSSSPLLNLSEPSSPLSPMSSSVVCPTSSEILPSIRSRVFVSGCAMNDDNPSPGIGVSRSIRSRFPHSRITGVDFSVESAGLADPVLDDIVVIDAWSVSKPAAHYLDVESFLQQDSNSYWIPCSDVEVHLLAHQAKKHHSSKDIRSRILCPGIGALKAILKPCVDAGDTLGMKVPKFFSVDDDTSVQEVYAWCMSMSYPVYVKGVHFGAQLCHTWQSAASAVYYLKKDLRQPVFIQRAESGWQKGLAFAAVEGQLTGALMLTKTVTTLLEKGWSGHLGAVPADLLARVSAFVKKTNWTGGGEIEFLEALDGDRWLIDFNPRFPAWIGASTLVNVNLPGAFLQHVMSFRASRFESDCGGISMNVPMPSDIAVNAAIADAYYTRTVVEQISTRCAPVITSGPDAGTHLPCGGAPRQHASRFAVAAGLVHAPDENHDDDDDDDTHVHETPDEADKKSVLIASTSSSSSSPKKNVSDAGLLCQPRGISSFSALRPRLSTIPSSFPSSSSSFSSSMCDPSVLHADLDRVCPRVSELYSLKTPCYILSESGVDACVSSCRKALECACAIAGIRKCSISASIKTNPHQKVLERARIGGAHAEGISIAEIRAALNAGFPLSECVLNGPAKFVDARNDKLLGDTDIFFSKEKREAMRAIFADNIEDLAYILTLIKDPDHWLKARTVGVRFSPSHSTLFSRFGVRQDAVSLRRTAELLKTLPQHIAIGIHFHFAASALGLGGWIAQARALLQVAKQLQDLTQRPIQVLDLGGGWPARMLEDSSTIQSIASVLKEALILMPAIEEVYLEPGKALTERAGALLSTVTGLREVAMSQELSSCSVLTHVPYASIRAAVLDSCICDVGALVAHPHPCLHLDDATQEWKLMGVGKDEVLGRICMEWDKLAIGVQLPYNMKPGDKVLLAFAGAYDISMGYGFGYGMLPDINTDVHWLP